MRDYPRNNFVMRLAPQNRRVGGIKIVFANKNYGKFMNRNKVDTLPKNSLFNRTIAKKRYGDFIFAFHFERKAQANGQSNARADQRRRNDMADTIIKKMHRASAAAAEARCIFLIIVSAMSFRRLWSARALLWPLAWAFLSK